ncbi:MAG: hypothetical protein V2I45_10770 [Halieaceae bacterium]|nr:hypothetical protein [Halieaceae bacterium]
MKRAAMLWLAVLSALPAVAQQMTPADQPLVAGRERPLPDPDTRSGWIRVEVAVLTDDASTTLASERWEATPSVRYPAQWRWLTDLEEQASLKAQFPGANIDVDERGSITVTLPPPAPSVTEDLTDGAAAIGPDGEPLVLDPTIDPMTGRPSATPSSNAVPLESLGAAKKSTAEEEEDWLAPFAEETSLTEAAARLEAGMQTAVAENVAVNEPEPPAPPPEPIAFLSRPTNMLEDGLNALRRQRGEGAAIRAAWVQPPGASNLPIVLDRSGDELLWPKVQGFVELRRGSDLRVGINFWLNTMGEYLPQGFAMDPPPRAAKRIAVLEPDPEPLLGTELGVGVDLAVAPSLQVPKQTDRPATSQSGNEAVAFIDPETGRQKLGNRQNDADTTMDGDSWPYRHLIAVADTRSVPENGVRYFDHPALQVLVTWRELTWGEVWSLGEADAEKTAELMPPDPSADDSEPASVVPPSMRERF